MSHHTFVIAEAASTHDGKLDAALLLVEMAGKIGADACKFQWTSSPERMVDRRHAPEYLDAYRTIAHPVEWHGILQQACDRAGVEYMTTVYLPEDISVIAPYVNRFKVASFEGGDDGFLGEHLKHLKPMVISLGMNGRVNKKFAGESYLYCVSAYPTPVEQLNLNRMWDGFDGLSDHTTHPWTGALAVAAGARIIEFHMRLHQTNLNNPDFLVSRDPVRTCDYVQNIRLAEVMMGDGGRKVQPCEEKMLRYRVWRDPSLLDR